MADSMKRDKNIVYSENFTLDELFSGNILLNIMYMM